MPDTITADSAFVALQVGGDDSDITGKISLEGLAEYVGGGGEGGDTIAVENCNMLLQILKIGQEFQQATIESVMIGCDVVGDAQVDQFSYYRHRGGC